MGHHVLERHGMDKGPNVADARRAAGRFCIMDLRASTIIKRRKILSPVNGHGQGEQFRGPRAGRDLFIFNKRSRLATIAITNRQKYTNSPVTSLTLSVQNADSMHFRLNAGPWSAWEQYAIAKTNMNISSGGQGAKYIYVEYKDRMGNMTSPVSDSTFYDTIPPRCAINTIGVINPAVWPHVISGASFDTMPGSGVKTVSVRLKNQATAMYWNGTAWAADSTAWTIATRTVVWYCSLATAAMNSGSYQIKAYAIDSAGNKGLMTTDSLQLIVPPGVSPDFNQ